MNTPIRLGIAGTGRMAARMVQAIAHTSNFSVSAVTSGDAARARWFADACGAIAVASVSELGQSDEVDAVYVAGRTRDHADAALAAIHAGKPVLVEKPMAADRDTAAELTDAAMAEKVLLLENLWCLTLPAYRALKSQLDGGGYGTPVHLRFDFGYPVARDSYASLFDPADGGVLLDRGVYGVALALHLLGPVSEVACTGLCDATGVDLRADLKLQHNSGAVSHIAVALDALLSNTAYLACTHGGLGLGAPVIGSETLLARQMPPQSAADAAPNAQSGLAQRLKSRPGFRKIKRFKDAASGKFLSYGSDPYLPVLSHFHDLIAAGQTQSDLIPHRLSLGTLDILQQARAQIGKG